MSISAAAASTVATSAATPVAPAQDSPARVAANAVSSAHVMSGHGDDTGKAKGRDSLPKDMTTAVEELRDALQTTPFGIQFEIDDVTHKVITKVVDRKTGELIRQLPSEEMVRVAHAMNKLQGLLIQQSA